MTELHKLSIKEKLKGLKGSTFSSQELTVSYSLIEGGENAIDGGANVIDWRAGNTDLNPQFLNPTNGDYRLSDYSPAIGAGTASEAVSYTHLRAHRD